MSANKRKAQQDLVVVGIGEALFDCFPDHTTLGGAPVNFTVHIHQLLQSTGGQGAIVSRVGADPLGGEIQSSLAARNMSTAAIQVDPTRPTGTVSVTLTTDGQPTYEIAREVAWDVIEFDETSSALAGRCRGVCFGTLAQRSPQSRATIHRFLEATAGALRLFDVNLRQDYYAGDVLESSLLAATVAKLNAEELETIAEILPLDLPQVVVAGSGHEDARVDSLAEQLRLRYALDMVVLTRGSKGTALYSSEGKTDAPPPEFRPREDADSVGAGDACCAGVMYGLLMGWQPQDVLNLANRMGAFVASQPGATPQLSAELLELASRGADRATG